MGVGVGMQIVYGLAHSSQSAPLGGGVRPRRECGSRRSWLADPVWSQPGRIGK
jgi:hypothetical protein